MNRGVVLPVTTISLDAKAWAVTGRQLLRDLLDRWTLLVLASHVESSAKTAYLLLSSGHPWQKTNSHFGLCSSHLPFLEI